MVGEVWEVKKSEDLMEIEMEALEEEAVVVHHVVVEVVGLRMRKESLKEIV